MNDSFGLNITKSKNNIIDEVELPDAPRIPIYKETFGGLIEVTEKWYKENGDGKY